MYKFTIQSPSYGHSKIRVDKYVRAKYSDNFSYFDKSWYLHGGHIQMGSCSHISFQPICIQSYIVSKPFQAG